MEEALSKRGLDAYSIGSIIPRLPPSWYLTNPFAKETILRKSNDFPCTYRLGRQDTYTKYIAVRQRGWVVLRQEAAVLLIKLAVAV